jgi:hypothetical protein
MIELLEQQGRLDLKVYSEKFDLNDLSEKHEQFDHKVYNEKSEILVQHDILMVQKLILCFL